MDETSITPTETRQCVFHCSEIPVPSYTKFKPLFEQAFAHNN